MSNRTSVKTWNIQTKEEAIKFVRKVLNTSFPIAIWRLPHSLEMQVLIDITSDEQRRTTSVEEINEGFLINPYNQNHPINSMVLNGDIVISLAEDALEMKVNPTVPGDRLEAFEDALTDSQSKHERKSRNPYENHPDYEKMVAEAVEKIKDGAISKVVLSRYKDFNLKQDFDPIALLEQLTHKYPNAFCYLTQTATYGTWMGATPEKLIAVEEDRFFSTDALAGTQLLQPGQDLSEIAWTQKEIEEQAMVSRYIINCFKKIRLREFDENGPKTIKAGSLAHLKTSFEVDMHTTNSPMLGSTMLELLHPTSAVCGYPLDLAKAFIDSHEDYERELYAGFLGPVGFDGDSRLFVNLRCMQLFQNKARLYAGAGITQDSNPHKELVETENKMQTLLSVLQ